MLFESLLCIMPLMWNHRLAEEQFFLYTLWSVNRCFADGGWCIGIIIGDTDTNTGLTQEAVIFQRYFVLKRSPLPVTGSCIFHQLNSQLTSEMCSSSAVPGEAPSAGAWCFPQPHHTTSLHSTVRPQSVADPFHPLLCIETLAVPHTRHPHCFTT